MLSRFCHVPSITNLVPSSQEVWLLSEHLENWRFEVGSALTQLAQLQPLGGSAETPET